ncbi:hypothetical protein [Hoylesella loescheii]|uniref:Uncharacterized protein n=1 Tax=Hoylesella loescheii DSM 19665 = JCM 12249 = ATCC 15930 TaxID=1122985 RepID=A0A069QFJ1_HOYLO|nr:hypothetical protein [Hoylesella loescheii]KDR50764.1 hypothetical protein HMPREF1991_03206 [Hoylesella loescheii DSM 19665 = JCM 12249 = ATCC 15930]
MKKETIFIITLLLFLSQSESGMRAASISHDTLKVVDYVSLLTGDSIKYWDDESPWGGGYVFQKKDQRFWQYDENRCFFIVCPQDCYPRYFLIDGDTLIVSYIPSKERPECLYLVEKILKLTEDTLIVQVIDKWDEFLPATYIKSKDQSSPLKNPPNLYNRRVPEPDVSKDKLSCMIDSIYNVLSPMNAFPDSVDVTIKVRVNKSGKVVKIKYKETPPDSITYHAFYSAFLLLVKNIPFKPGRDVETKETFEMEVLLPFTIHVSKKWFKRKHRKLRRRKEQ